MTPTQYKYAILVLSMFLFTFLFGFIGQWMGINWFHYVGIAFGSIIAQYYLHKNPHKDNKTE